jgi:hypothetical protein
MYADSIIMTFEYNLKSTVMKTYPNILKPVKQYMLIGLIVLITLFGLTLKANAQSSLVENNVDKINNSMVIRLANYDFEVIIPKVSKDELNSIKNASFNQMVYVTGKTAGYYFYMGAQWEMQKVKDVFELIDMNLTLQQPSHESLIIIAGEEDGKALLDYNHHVRSIYEDFGFDAKNSDLAINLE